MAKRNLILRITLSFILLMHSIPGMLDGGISGFGQYLHDVGFGSIGLVLAWLIKLSHLGTIVALLSDKWIIPASIITILIFIAGIVMVHWPNGWFVVGGGSNGIEYNVLLIACFVHLAIDRYKKNKKGEL